MNKIKELKNKVKEVFQRYVKKVSPELFTGKIFVISKTIFFIGGSIVIGAWLGLKLFFPDEYILSQINKELFIRDMGLEADKVSVSILGNISLYNGQLTEKGERAFTFKRISFRPSLVDLMRKRVSGELQLADIDNQGGILTLNLGSGETPCYAFESRDVPLSIFRAFLNDISFSGILTGEGSFCLSEENRYNGNLFLVSDEITFRGKIPTVMGPVDIGRINLGSFDVSAEMKNGKVEISRMVTKGLVNIDVAGSAHVNTRFIMSSRLDLDVRIDVPDVEKIKENPALSILMGLMAQYRVPGESDSYAIQMRGPASKPSINRAPPKRRGKDKSSDSDGLKNRAQKLRSRMAARRKSSEAEQKSQERLNKQKAEAGQIKEEPQISKSKEAEERTAASEERENEESAVVEADEKPNEELSEEPNGTALTLENGESSLEDTVDEEVSDEA